MRARGGFTLWEMAIVMAVLAISAMVVVPRFTALGTDRAAQTGDSLVSLLRDARRVAIERRQMVGVYLDPVTGRFRVDTTGVHGTGLFVEGSLEFGTWETVVTERPRLRYIFWPTGAALGDTVVVRGTDGAVTVAVGPWSGVPLVYAHD